MPDRDRPAQAQGRRGDRDRSPDRGKKGLIEQAYRWAEEVGLALWCRDEAGPYRTVPYPGESWSPVGDPARQAHEYVRNGTAKLLTLFRPRTGEVRATGVRNAPNAVLHPWLHDQLTPILATLPTVSLPEAGRPALARRETWLGHIPREPLPPLRLILVWDNLAGHLSYPIMRWLFQHGIMPLYTPLAGSWLNMAESLQRIIARRALAGQHPQTPEEIIGWFEETVDGWNAAPAPFVWDGKRRERRRRARARHLGGSAATLAQRQLNAA